MTRRTREEPEVPGRASAGPVLLLLPLVFFALSVLYLTRESRPAPLSQERAPETPAALVQGWAGVLHGPGGERLHARLARLHAAPSRQVFERDALRRRLGLFPGEPWRLSLELHGASSELALAGLAIVDERGPALAPLEPAPPASGVADPLAVLLAPPRALWAGEEASLVLWGREPGEGARLEGLSLRFGGDLQPSLALERRELEAGPDESALARLEVDLRPGPSAAEEERAARRGE